MIPVQLLTRVTQLYSKLYSDHWNSISNQNQKSKAPLKTVRTGYDQLKRDVKPTIEVERTNYVHYREAIIILSVIWIARCP